MSKQVKGIPELHHNKEDAQQWRRDHLDGARGKPGCRGSKQVNGGCKAWLEARPAPGEVNGHRERDPRAVAHCTGGPRPRKRGPEDPGLYKGGVASCWL